MKLNVGNVLTEIFRERRLTIKEVAKASGVPASTLSEWKLNRAPKNPEQALKVAEALDISLHFLLFGVEDRQEPLQKLLKEDVFSGTFEINIKRIKIK